MTDTPRYIPRYIRNTDAFGWQGADSPDGPWRSITPPQSSAPWQTTSPMDALPQTSAEVSGAKMLSPAAQVVLASYKEARDEAGQVAAALRAAADQVFPLARTPWGSTLIPVLTSQESRRRLLALATELENHQ